MPSSKVQLTGGSFQDSEGNLLSGGYLTFKLSQDSNVNSSQICAGIEVTVTLDNYGAIIGGQYVWGNDQLSPVNSYYTVTGYTASGQQAWGPNNQQVTGNGGTFDVGTWVPNSVISWTPPAQPLTLEVNGTDAGSQTLLDLQQGTNITLTDNGSGVVTIAASGASTSGYNVADVPWNFQSRGSTSTLSTAGFSYCQVMFANSILLPTSSSKLKVYLATGTSAAIGEMCVIRTLRDSLTTVDITAVKFGGSATPTLTTGMHTSDAISLAIDSSHDYYICFTGNAFGGSGQLASNSGSISNPLYTSFSGNANTGSNLSSVWADRKSTRLNSSHVP
jgi:hypothetical protein